MGLDFYRRAVALQRRYGEHRRISNSFQTNGLLLDEQWCDFFKKHDFLVGLSLDGPPHIHDACRRARNGAGSHALVMRALECLQRSNVRYNILACVNRENADHPLEVYEFLKDAGATFIQFLPVVERVADTHARSHGLKLHGPPSATPDASSLTAWSVPPLKYGTFLSSVFDQWVRHDVGSVFVMNFEWALANHMRLPGAVCHHLSVCGRSLILEHNGDIYACDHYVYPEYRLGNILTDDLSNMQDAMNCFGHARYSALPSRCRKCPVLPACWGDCPKHRFVVEAGEAHSYLCEDFRLFFTHITPYLCAMRKLLAEGRPVSQIMGATLVYVDKNPGAPQRHSILSVS